MKIQAGATKNFGLIVGLVIFISICQYGSDLAMIHCHFPYRVNDRAQPRGLSGSAAAIG